MEECGNTSRKDHPDFRLNIFTCDLCDQNFVIKRKFKLHLDRHKREQEQALVAMKESVVATKNTPENTQEDQSHSNKDDSGNNIENIDPECAEEVCTGVVLKEVVAEEEGVVSSQEIDFIKAVKQLQELEGSSSTCQHCGKKLSSRKATLEHEVNVHGDLTNADQYFNCEICPKVFISKALRANHMVSHTDERRYQCHLCALRFKTTGNLRAHLASCHDPSETGLTKNFSCKFCSKTFRFPAQIEQHERVHTKEKPFNCPYCGLGFSVKCNLKAHLETHKSREERSFKCEQCNHAATTLPLLKLHMHSHTGERPYICELCGESYRRPSNLRRHKKNMCKVISCSGWTHII